MTDDRNRPMVRTHWRALLTIFLFALLIRSLTGYFLATHLGNSDWFPFGIYNFFHDQAVGVIDGTRPAFWLTDPSDPRPAIYPPGYSLWLAVVYAISGMRSPYVVQIVQLVLDSASVLLIVAIGAAAYRWSVGFLAGLAASLSPLLALYGVTPLADAPTSWIVLGGVLSLLLACKKNSLGLALLAGALLGASCWFRANGLLLAGCWALAVVLFAEMAWQQRFRLAAAVVLAAAIVISPVIVRNSFAFQAFVPTGLGVGTNLWEGIGETDRADEFGAVYGDDKLVERERVEQELGDDPRVTLYWPNGVARDRARARKALAVIASEPAWYAGVMAKRMWGLLKYAGDPSGIYGSAGINITPMKCLPDKLRFRPLSLPATLLGWIQSVFRFAALPLMLIGIALGLKNRSRVTLILLATILYYLVLGSFMHSEIRYSLPMQAVLLVFVGVAVAEMIAFVQTKIRN